MALAIASPAIAADDAARTGYHVLRRFQREMTVPPESFSD
jgi:hypothetical protein